MLSDHFQTLAGYNAWANGQLYDAVAALSDADYRAARACAYFGSVEGTLNHILLCDRIWFRRMAGVDPGYGRLDEILYGDLAALRSAREEADEEIIAQVAGYGEADLARPMRYRLIGEPGEGEMQIQAMLATAFNHQTHHRGQVHAMLKEAGRAPPPLDLIGYLL